MKSIYQNLGGTIKMPEFQGRKLYMHKMHMSDISLPKDFQDFENSIDAILQKISNRDDICYITIDEKHINGETHRRPGIHVDFNWYEGNGHTPEGHDRGDGVIIVDGYHGGGHSRNKPGWGGTTGQWGKHNEDILGGMLLVSNYAGCQVWEGDYEGEIKEGGDCSLIDVTDLKSEIMQPEEVYFVNALGIHESLPIREEVNRTLIRINFHPEYIFS